MEHKFVDTKEEFGKQTFEKNDYTDNSVPFNFKDICIKCGYIKGQDYGNTCEEHKAFVKGHILGEIRTTRDIIERIKEQGNHISQIKQTLIHIENDYIKSHKYIINEVKQNEKTTR